jgi:ABC-type enterochelin transport system permease subunit
MRLFGLLDHLLNFVAPALVVGFLVAALAPLLMKKARPHHSWLTQSAINSGASVLVLLAGLVIFGHDGKMATYAAMVLVCASSQWLAAKAWRG